MSKLRIIVLGYIVRGPLGGLVWHHLQYVIGLSQLGHDVFFLEDSDDYPSCYDPSRNVIDVDPTYGLRFAKATFEHYGFGERWAYYDAHTSRWFGPCAGRIVEICADADLLLNLSGINPMRPWLEPVPARAFVDTDPVFTQVRHLKDPVALVAAADHTAFFTFGELFGRGSTIPDDGFPWQPTRQPVVLDLWPVTQGPATGAYTTVMQWDSYAVCEHEGVRYGMKSTSFQPYLELPHRTTGARFELALGGHTAPHAQLNTYGWTVRNSLEPTRDPWTYQRYLQDSRAEFSVAKEGYVATRSGWFSERSVGYLASGRPVLLQDTGFSDWMTCGLGVVPFATPEEALEGIAIIEASYEAHCIAARELAAAYFASGRVLETLIAQTLDGDSK